MGNTVFNRFKPGVPKRALLLVAAIVWTIAGLILITKGTNHLTQYSNHLTVRFIAATIFGVLFFFAMFAGISLNHINRIRAIDIVKPCIFSFFNFKSYFLMAGMIALGIILRRLSFINHDFLFTFYVGMGIPLLLSAIRFYYAWLTYHNYVAKNE